MGSLRDCTWVLGLADYRVIGLERQTDGRLVVELERRGMRRYVCSGCTRRTGRVRDAKVRTWDDLPWAEHPVTLRYPLRRLSAHWTRLSIDADQSRGGPACRELGDRAPGRTGVPRRVGSDAAETPPAPSRGR